MRGDRSTVKDRLDIAEVISGYVKLEKAGASFKARCPFHNEKTGSFFVSPTRQSFYCFGCNAKGDIFTFIENMEGLDFPGALKMLAEKAGVELSYTPGTSKTEKDKLLEVLEAAALFFENKLSENKEAKDYLISRGIDKDSIEAWRIGYAPDDWRMLYLHLETLGYKKELMVKAGLVKVGEGKDPYDVFRDRLIFPLSDPSGKIIAFSGRALLKDAQPKYLNSPETIVFTKSEVLYGLDKAKTSIRKKDYSVLVEGQIDLVLSHQAHVTNTVASSGTAFTRMHLERLKRLSNRVIMAFDADSAGEKAGFKAAILALSLGLEVKIAPLPQGMDPAELVSKNPEEWKNVLRISLPAIEFFFKKIVEKEPDQRKLGREVERLILPMIKILQSSMEQSHFVSMISRQMGIKEEVVWEDLKRVKKPEIVSLHESTEVKNVEEVSKKEVISREEQLEERLKEIKLWKEELPKGSSEISLLDKEEKELNEALKGLSLKENLSKLLKDLARAESNKDEAVIRNLTLEIQKIHKEVIELEEKGNVL